MSTPTSWPATPATPTTTAPTPAWSICSAPPENGFVAEPPTEKVDIIYLCFPNNPTGAVATRAQLEAWVKYARANDSDHPLRRRLRGLHQRPRHPAFDLRDPRRARVRDRVPQLLQERRLHRRALRLHRRAEGPHGHRPPTARASRCIRSGSRRHTHEVQRRRPTSCSAAPRRSTSPRARRRSTRSSSTTWAMPASSAKPAQAVGLTRLRRRERALHLGRCAARRHELGDVRPHAERGECRHHARQRLRRRGRRLLPHQRLQQSRANAEEVARRIAAMKW